MEYINNERITLFFSKKNSELADLMIKKLPMMEQLIQSKWNLEIPEKYRFYIMDSMYQSILHPASFLRKIILILTFPIWYKRAKKAWKISAGWTMNNHGEKILGIKSIFEMKKSIEANKNKIYNSIHNDIYIRAECTACHEMTHVFTSHLHLPFWLNEGIAQYTVDKYLGEPSISTDTIGYLFQDNKPNHPYLTEFLYGYWIVRYIEDIKEGNLENIIKDKNIDGKIAELFNVPEGNFREQARMIIKDYYYLN
jgi:hypothetical protein